MKYKIWLIFMCIPCYIYILIGEHYHARMGNDDDKFVFKEITKDYWEVVWEDLTEK